MKKKIKPLGETSTRKLEAIYNQWLARGGHVLRNTGDCSVLNGSPLIKPDLPGKAPKDVRCEMSVKDIGAQK